MKKRVPKRTVGRRELVDFPQFQLWGVEAKVDTGAYTSAIHCSNIHVEPDAAGRAVLHVQLLDPSHPNFDGTPMQFASFSLRDVKSSNGEVQERYVIRATLRIFGEDFDTEFSLSDRSDMKYPVLLGRRLLRQGRFLVDVARLNVSCKTHPATRPVRS